MMRAIALLLMLLAAMPVAAADRTIGTGSFRTVRISGPYEVRIEAGTSPRVTVSGDRRAIDSVEVRVDGDVLAVRAADEAQWGEQRGGASWAPPVVTLTTPGLSSASSFGGARLTIARMAGDRVDLAISGAGAIAVADLRTPQLNATLVGSGSMILAGRADRARLVTNGAGTVDAGALDAGELTVHLDGTGETKARARYSAEVVDSGIGSVTILGNPKCTVRQGGGGPVRCGPNP